MPHVTGPQVSAHEVVSTGAGGAPGCRARVERNLAHTLTPGNCTHLGWFPIQAPALGAGAAARGWGLAGGSVGTPGGSSNDPPAPVSLWEGSCHHPAARPGSGSGSQAEATCRSILRGSRTHPRGLGFLWGTPPPLLELRSCLCPPGQAPRARLAWSHAGQSHRAAPCSQPARGQGSPTLPDPPPSWRDITGLPEGAPSLRSDGVCLRRARGGGWGSRVDRSGAETPATGGPLGHQTSLWGGAHCQ